MKILGKSVATAQQMATYLLSVNPNPQIKMEVEDFCRLYLYMGALEGVRGDILFAQSCKETGNFKFTGTVSADQNNYCGLGTVNASTKGAYFPDEATGILAQAQHAKGYATTEALIYDCVDPRYHLLKKGCAPEWEDLAGKWAVAGYDTKKYASLEEANKAKDSYGYSILNIYNKIVGVVEEDKPVEDAPVVETPEADAPVEENKTEEIKTPLKGKMICLDAGHFGKRYNKCPAIPEYAESEMVWKLHLLLKMYLEQMGAVVITTRSDQNKDLELHLRGMASKGCVLFLSLHSNAVGGGMNENIDHVACYHLTDDHTTDADEISKALALKLAPVIAGVMGVSGGYKVLQRKAESDRNKDGFKNDNFYGVLHGARLVNTPAIILEHGFHTHSKTVRWLLDDNNLDALARAEAQTIAEYFSGESVVVDKASVVAQPTLRNGSSGAQVELLQEHLNLVMEAGLKVDGGFGDKTQKAVENFQSKYELKVDGVYGPKSYEKMKEILESLKKEQDNDTEAASVPYKVKVANVPVNDVLNIRKEPTTNADITGRLNYNDPNTYTIVEEKDGWGKMKSGIGWIFLKYTTRV